MAMDLTPEHPTPKADGQCVRNVGGSSGGLSLTLDGPATQAESPYSRACPDLALNTTDVVASGQFPDSLHHRSTDVDSWESVSILRAESSGRGRGGVVRANRGGPGANTCLALGVGGEPSRGTFSAGRGSGSGGAGAGKTGGAAGTTTTGVSAGRVSTTAGG